MMWRNLANGLKRLRMEKNPQLHARVDSDPLSVKPEKAVREDEPPTPERKTALRAIAARNIKR
jgi:hypothetical protein